MNTQRVQNCTQATLICMINDYFDAILGKYRMHRESIRLQREREQMYQEFKKLNEPGLRDIGMDDPQNQLKTLGRYL